MLVAKRVTGEEEVPEGAVAVLTPDAPDVLSHVSVRARNMKVLFAICHEEGTLKEVEDKEGTTISLQVGYLLYKGNRRGPHLSWFWVEQAVWDRVVTPLSI